MRIRLAAALLAIPLVSQDTSKPSFYEPALNPAREEIAFVSGGDIWTVPLAGGEARLLVSHAATESRPAYSPDGKKLAFGSNRTGGGDIYVLDLDSGEQKRITFDDGNESLDGWSRDGKYLYFTTNSTDIAGTTDVHRIPASGGTPLPVADDRYMPEFYSAPGPTPNTFALTARGGQAFGQWWRKGHSHIDESEIWIRREGVYERAGLPGGARDMWPMWSADGKKLYYISDRSGAENIWEKTVGGGEPKQLTQFRDGRLIWPKIGQDGKRIVFERDFAVWTFDVASGKAAAVPITLRGAPAGPAVSRQSFNTIQDLALSPDGRKIAVVAHGEIFAASARDGGAAFRVTRTPGVEGDLAWSPDSKKIVYRSDRGGKYQLYLFDFTNNTESQLSSGSSDYGPAFSPDGKKVSFLRDGEKLMVTDVGSKQETLVATASFSRPPNSGGGRVAWSPDSQWIAFLAPGERNFSNAQVVAAAGGAVRQASFVPNTFGGSLAWSPDGKYLLFRTGQRTEEPEVMRIDLQPRVPRFREDQFTDLFKDTPRRPDAAKPETQAKEPVRIEFDGIRRRITSLPLGVEVGEIAISPDGKTLLITASAEGQVNLYTYSLDELARERPVARQLTSTPGGKSDAQWSPDSREVYFLEQGRVLSVNVENRNVRPVAVTAEMDVDFDQEKRQVLSQAWVYLNDNFYDPQFHGVDWKSMPARYAPYVAGARTPDEMRRVIGLMIGELNASHTGISAGGPPPGAGAGNAGGTGKLGLRFDRAAYDATGQLKVSEVIPLSPAAIAGVVGGETVAAVDGVTVTASHNLHELLQNTVGRRVTLSLESASAKRDVVISPIGTQQEKQLLYRAWVENRREYVNRASSGRLGYVHMPDMSAGSLRQLYLDLDADNHARDGVVIDIRNNNGGFVNVYAIDVFARRGYLNMTPRGRSAAAPARTQLGQRSLEKPTILVTNQHSLSDAEDFAEGYRTLKLGKVVGEPTAGWIIYTGNVTLIDGSSLRLPSTRITTNDGVNMERNPRPVDIELDRPLGEWQAGKDSQLDRAVAELVKQLGPARRASQ